MQAKNCNGNCKKKCSEEHFCTRHGKSKQRFAIRTRFLNANPGTDSFNYGVFVRERTELNIASSSDMILHFCFKTNATLYEKAKIVENTDAKGFVPQIAGHFKRALFVFLH